MDVAMEQSGNHIPNAILMTLLGFATLGGFTPAFTSMKTGRGLRGILIALAGRLHSRPGRSDPMEGTTMQVAFI